MGQRTSYSASFRHRFCNISFVARPSYIYTQSTREGNKGRKHCLAFIKKKNACTDVFNIVDDSKVIRVGYRGQGTLTARCAMISPTTGQGF
jgi:hypothetical protein